MKLMDCIVKGEMPQQKLIAVTESLYNSENPQQANQLASVWLENIEKVEQEQHRDYFDAFFVRLSPRFLRNEKHTSALKALLAKHESNDDKALLVKLLREEIAQMELIKAIEKHSIEQVARESNN